MPRIEITRVVVRHYPDRKKPCLVIEQGNQGMILATFRNEKTVVLKVELGDQADILYHLLTEQTTKAEIKAESEDKE